MLVTKLFADKGQQIFLKLPFLSPTTMFISRAIGRVATSAFRAPATRLATKPLGVQAANKGKKNWEKKTMKLYQVVIDMMCFSFTFVKLVPMLPKLKPLVKFGKYSIPITNPQSIRNSLLLVLARLLVPLLTFNSTKRTCLLSWTLWKSKIILVVVLFLKLPNIWVRTLFVPLPWMVLKVSSFGKNNETSGH